MVHGRFNPHPGDPFATALPVSARVPERERYSHYLWLKKAAADKFFSLIGEWLGSTRRADDEQERSAGIRAFGLITEAAWVCSGPDWVR